MRLQPADVGMWAVDSGAASVPVSAELAEHNPDMAAGEAGGATGIPDGAAAAAGEVGREPGG